MSSLTDRRAGGARAAKSRAERGADRLLVPSLDRSSFFISLFIAFVFATAPPAFAQEADCGTIRWDPAVGPVVGYDVFVQINDDEQLLFESSVNDTRAIVSGPEFQEGDALRFQIVALAADGRRSPSSELSDVIFCATVPTPGGVGADDGSIRDPNQFWWEPVEHAEYYVVFRSTSPGVSGEYLDQTEEVFYNDETAETEIPYYYTVAAVAGSRVSGFSEEAVATRGADYPLLVSSESRLVYHAQPGDVSGEQYFELSNAGDWELSYRAWPGARWIQLSQTSGHIDDEVDTIGVTYDLSNLPIGRHQAEIFVYTFAELPESEDFSVGPPLRIQVEVNVPSPNLAPVLHAPIAVGAFEGETVIVPFHATDPDGDLVEIGLSGNWPSWVRFESLGPDSGQLVLTPDFDAAGVWAGALAAWDDGIPGQLSLQLLTIVVGDRNRAPLVAPAPDQDVRVGEVRTLLVSSFDPDLGDRLALASSSLPGFATFVDLGNGTAEIVLAPEPGDAGTYLVIYGAVDDGSPPYFTGDSFTVTVTD